MGTLRATAMELFDDEFGVVKVIFAWALHPDTAAWAAPARQDCTKTKDEQSQHEGHREPGRAPVQPQHSGEEKEEQEEEEEGVEEEAEVEEML
ncbi:hypothetical protein TURU_059275 [Turdus rufiventris]|nr:hypothetical protein TURU_059275 [Turdus rufiventris]